MRGKPNYSETAAQDVQKTRQNPFGLDSRHVDVGPPPGHTDRRAVGLTERKEYREALSLAFAAKIIRDTAVSLAELADRLEGK